MSRSSISRFNPLVVALVYEGLCSFEYACAAEVFGLSRPEVGKHWYQFETAGLTRRSVSAAYGLRLLPDAGLERIAQAGTIIIPGWKSIDAPVPRQLVAALWHAYENGARLASICSGAVVLAATGLLDGKRIATHWRYAPELQARFPAVDVQSQVLYVDEGQLLTSAGSAAGLDMCLHLVRRDFGPKVANQVARRLVIPPHRDGGQAQFVERPVAPRDRTPLSSVFGFIQKHLAEELPIALLARKVAMSERSFMRHFKQATGTSPADWLIAARMHRARELLESSTHNIDVIAEQSGFGTAITLRHHFRRRLGISPSAYRRRFGKPSSTLHR